MLIDKRLLKQLDNISEDIDRKINGKEGIDIWKWLELNDRRINIIVEILHEMNDDDDNLNFKIKKEHYSVKKVKIPEKNNE